MGLEFYVLNTNPAWQKHFLFRFDKQPPLTSKRYDTDDYRIVSTSGQSKLIDDTAPVDPRWLPPVVEIRTYSGRKPADPAKAPDIWTAHGSTPIVTQKARDFIAARDADAAFFAVDFVHQKSGDRFGTDTFFYWWQRRFIQLDLDAQAPALAAPIAVHMDGLNQPAPPMLTAYTVLSHDAGAQAMLADCPFWMVWPWTAIHFSTAAYHAAIDAGLKGLDCGAGRQMRHVTRQVI